MKGVLIRLANVQNRADGTFDAPVYIVFIDKLLKAFERIFKDRAHEAHRKAQIS
jgi:hypothetical protein